ncbi:MAG: DUF859 domain-containing protein, partial [Bacilli bacterium]|nr:DUF859 domain-containing protein [Bacilli bacterium]
MGVRKNVDISTGNPSISGYYSIVEGDYDIASNSSTVTLTAYLRRTNNHSGTPTNINNRSITRAFYVDGIEYGSTENISLIIPNDKSYVQFYQKTVTVTHNSDGSKNLSVGFASTCSSNSAFSVPGTDTTLDLTKIPRYGTANQSLLGKDETSISISWSSDSIVDYVWYSIDNGYSWIDVGPTWAYSGSYKISGLNANTGYNIKTKLRRQDSQLATDSSTSYIVTYDWPYITGVSDFTIGNNINFTFYNPLGRNCEFYLQPTNGNEVSIGSNPGTNASVVSTTTINNLLYQASPNNNKNSFAIKLVYGSIIRHGYGNYTIPSSPPTFSNFDYLDVDATIVSITGSNQFIVKNKSNLRVKITSANKMIAKNFATANRYEISCGNRTKSLNYSENETYVDLGTINSAGQMNIIVKAYDSRGFYTQVSKTINVIDYAEPSQSNSLYRINNYENETKLMIEGTYSLVECNGIVKNSIEKIRYRYKKIDGEYGDYKTLIGTMIGNKYSTSQQTLDLDNRYAFVFEIGITDKFGIEVVKEIPLPEGIPIMYINADKKNVGIGCINENGEYSFEVKGKIRADDDIILKSGNTVLDYEFVDESIKLTNNI